MDCGGGVYCPNNLYCCDGDCRSNPCYYYGTGGSGTGTGTGDGWNGTGSSNTGSGDVTCASQYVESKSGSCTLDYCIQGNEASYCSDSYYVANGTKVHCGSCDDANALQACAQRAVNICNGSSGSSSESAGCSFAGIVTGSTSTAMWSLAGLLGFAAARMRRRK